MGLSSTKRLTRDTGAEEDLGIFFKLSGDMLCIAGFDGYLKRLNPAWSKTLGFSEDELQGGLYARFVHPEDRDSTMAEVQKLIEGGDSVCLENRYLCKDGSFKRLSWMFTSLAEQHVIYGVAREIEERMRAQGETGTSDAEFKKRASEDTATPEAANQELLRVNRTLRTVSSCNQALVYATEESAFLQQICRIIVEVGGYRLAWVGYAEQDEAKTVRPVAHAGYEEGYLALLNITWSDTERGRGPAGTAIRAGNPAIVRNVPMDTSFVPWREDAIRRGYASVIALPLVVGTLRIGALTVYAAEIDAFDPAEVKLLTELASNLAYGVKVLRARAQQERVEAENARLIAAIEQAAEAVVFTDIEGQIQYVNPAFTRITGFSREEVLGHNLRLLKSGEHDRTFYEHLWRTILAGEVWQGEITNRRKDGSLYHEQMTITPVRNEQGKIRHFIAIKHDISERKRLEAQLFHARKMEAIGRLAGGVAHDFNNLLTIICGYSDLLLQSLMSSDPARGYVSEIKDAGERAASLTRQLLAFSRRQVVEPRVLDVNVIMAAMEKMLRRMAGEDIEFVTVLRAGSGLIKADQGQIEQTVMNLVVNARDAMPQGGKLIIETANVELDDAYARSHIAVKPGPYVMLAVSDTGFGMDEETQAHIFEPFFTTKEQGRGTGLGLATVYAIIKQNGGNIWVYSEVGRGTTIKIYLPRVEDCSGQSEKPTSASRELRGSETILVVEDEEAVRSLVVGLLKAKGYTVLEAGRVDDALSVCLRHWGPIHLVLTDVVLPHMSGRDLADRLKPLCPGIRILYMSGYTQDAVASHGVIEPGATLLQKPFTSDILAGKVREVLDAATNH